jgi:predicted DCC family thiol-disulfide oxidoreductase YuxK
MLELRGKKIVLFDGVCNLCTGSVRFIIGHDRRGVLSFAAFQSNAGREILRRFQLTTARSNSFFLVDDGRIYDRSSAALRVMRYCHGIWKLLSVLIAIPRFLRDAVYDWIARNRYEWFGKKNECWIPSADLRARFLE